MSKENLWKTFRKPGELLLKSTLNDYKKAWLLGRKFKEIKGAEYYKLDVQCSQGVHAVQSRRISKWSKPNEPHPSTKKAFEKDQTEHFFI